MHTDNLQELWLSVSDAITGSHEFEYRFEVWPKWPGAELAKRNCRYRISPVFPAASRSRVPAATDAQIIAFFFHLDGFSALSALSDHEKERLWFSQGLASIVAIGITEEEVATLRGKWNDGLRGVEVWHLKVDGYIESVNFWTLACDETKPKVAEIVIPEGLDTDSIALARQIQAVFHNVANHAAINAPEVTDSLIRLAEDVRDVLEEIAFFQNVDQNPPRRISEEHAKELRASPQHRLTELNHRIDLLVQLNSSLSYVLSQGFHGASPILSHPSLVGDHSFLGVGTAWRALSRFAHYVNRVLSVYPITDVVAREYKGRSSVPLDSEDQWSSSEALDPDGYWEQCVESPVLPKLAFFSSRLGFGETYYNITAAAQALHAADSPRRSLMTLSHEMMHAHVVGLLATILCPDESPRLTEKVFEFFLAQWIDTGPNAKSKKCFLTALRCALFDHCRDNQANKGFWQLHATDKPKLPIEIRNPANGSEVAALVRDSYRFLNEVMVHTLDFHYFYNEATDVYLDSIWESWMTVPGVVDNPREYVLRSLIAIASPESGRVLDILAEALRELERCVERLLARHPDDEFLSIAKALVTDGKVREWLSFVFPPHYRLARIVRRFLRSSQIQRLMSANDDENIRTVELDADNAGDGVSDIYDLETSSFTGAMVNNPIAFIRDRLWRAFSSSTKAYPENYRTAWVFLVLGSARCDVERCDSK